MMGPQRSAASAANALSGGIKTHVKVQIQMTKASRQQRGGEGGSSKVGRRASAALSSGGTTSSSWTRRSILMIGRLLGRSAGVVTQRAGEAGAVPGLKLGKSGLRIEAVYTFK